MIKKYINQLTIQRTDTGKQYYTTVIPNSIPLDTFEFSIVTRGIQRFDNLAQKYYKDSTKWWIIAKANGMVDGSMFIKPGTRILIPSVGL